MGTGRALVAGADMRPADVTRRHRRRYRCLLHPLSPASIAAPDSPTAAVHRRLRYAAAGLRERAAASADCRSSLALRPPRKHRQLVGPSHAAAAAAATAAGEARCCVQVVGKLRSVDRLRTVCVRRATRNAAAHRRPAASRSCGGAKSAYGWEEVDRFARRIGEIVRCP